MEAIMKAFEKMEKRQERRKEALARIDHTTKKPAAIGIKPTEEPKKEKFKAKVISTSVKIIIGSYDKVEVG